MKQRQRKSYLLKISVTVRYENEIFKKVFIQNPKSKIQNFQEVSL